MLRLINHEIVIWPKAENDRNKFIEEKISRACDALIDINSSANLEVFLHVDDKTNAELKIQKSGGVNG